MEIVKELTQAQEYCVSVDNAQITSGTAYLRGPNPADGNIGSVDQSATQNPENVDIWEFRSSTDSFEPGQWQVELWATIDGSDKLLVTHSLTIVESIRNQAAGIDRRSHAQKTLAMLEAYLEGATTGVVLNYRINNRELQYHKLSEIVSLLHSYRNKVKLEKAAACGKSPIGTIKYRY